MSFDLETEVQTEISLDDAIDGDRPYPSRCSIRRDIGISKTVVLLREDQHEFIQRVGMNFSHFASAIIQDRIKMERAIADLGEIDARE